MTHTLAAHAVPAPAADGGLGHPEARRSTAAILFRRVVVALSALAVRPQVTRVAKADATLVCAVAMVTLWAVGLGFGLAFAVALKGDSDGECVLEPHRLDDEGFLLLFGAGPSSGLHTERHLDHEE